MKPLEIEISNKKIIIIIGFCILCVLIGLLIMFGMSDWTVTYFGFEINKTVLGGGIIGFFTVSIILLIPKLNNKFKLILDETGIKDEMTNNSVGLIKWSDIIGVDQTSISNQNLILIKVKNPEIYIDRVKGLKKQIMRSNQNNFGAAITISSGVLKFDHEELINLIKSKITIA